MPFIIHHLTIAKRVISIYRMDLSSQQFLDETCAVIAPAGQHLQNKPYAVIGPLLVISNSFDGKNRRNKATRSAIKKNFHPTPQR